MASDRMDPLVWAAMCIVNHLYEIAGVPVDVRQRLNDEADAYVLHKLQDLHVAGSTEGTSTHGN